MKNFDSDLKIEGLNKRMPYSTPDQVFFERVTDETMARIEREELMRLKIRRVVISLSTMAAAVIVAIVILATPTSKPTYESELARFDSSLDAYMEELPYADVSAMARQSDADIIEYIN